MIVIQKNEIIKKYFEIFVGFLNNIPCFKMNFDLKMYINKKKKPELYQKIRETLMIILKMTADERIVFMLSLKEYKNKSKYVSEMMSNFKDQYKLSRSGLHKSENSPGDSMQKKFESILDNRD